MKKMSIIAAILCMGLVIAACGQGVGASSTTAATSSSEATAPSEMAASSEATTASSKDIGIMLPERTPPFNAQQLFERFSERDPLAGLAFSEATFDPPLSGVGFQCDDPGVFISVYQYENSHDAGVAITSISDLGYSIKDAADDTASNIPLVWNGTPHFFKCFTMVILYCGDDADILSGIIDIVGHEHVWEQLGSL